MRKPRKITKSFKRARIPLFFRRPKNTQNQKKKIIFLCQYGSTSGRGARYFAQQLKKRGLEKEFEVETFAMGKNFLRKIKSLSNAEVIVMVPGQLIHSAQTFRFKTRILKAILKKRNIKIVEEDYTNYKIETESFDRNVEEYFENNFDQFMAKINKVLGEK